MSRAWLAWLAGVWPLAVDPADELADSVRYLADRGLVAPETDAARVTRATNTLAVAVGCLAFVSVVVVAPSRFRSGTVGAVTAILTGTLLAWLGRRLPVWLAAFDRTRAVGAVTTVVGLAAARLRLDPAPELAARFATRGATGPLAAALSRSVRGARAEPDAGLTSFAAEWSAWFPALERAVALLRGAADAPPAARDRTLDRAVAAVGDELEARSAAFAGSVRGPITALYAFGVLLPLALVAALPAVGVASVPLRPSWLAVGYDLLLPVAVAVGGARLTLARPVAFPPPSVAGHPELPKWRRAGPVAGLLAALCAWVAASATAGSWAGPTAAVGVGVGTTLVVRYGPAATIRERVRRLERALPDALALVGQRVADGDSVERAIEGVGSTITGPAGAVFSAAAQRQRTLGVGVERAFRGANGPLVHTPSARAVGVARLLAVAASEGRPAGRVLVGEAERLETLQGHERRARREVRRVTDSLRHTAAVFGPLVGGATVALSGRVAAFEGAAAFGPATLGPIVGRYVLALAVLLPTLATAVERGLDRTLVGYRIGLACLTATTSFLAGAVAVGFVV